ncbi:MAG TPA: hypothetical protein VKA31_04225 [Mariprofundaceae bacterium]|nr:hypothetical protein [Mariprofundaceae bacterium]
MDWTLWLALLLVGAFLWWASFYATKRMRIGKNLEREEQARRNLEAKALRVEKEKD